MTLSTLQLAPTPLDFGPFTQVVQFLMELDKLKSVYRKNKLLNNTRHENTAEHSWQFAMAAMSFAPYIKSVDIQRVIKMALLHDVVEIDAGDVMVYDLAARAAVQEHEIKAAERIFALLPEPQSSEFLSLWKEYEAGESQDAKFANALDRVMPILLNLHNNGQSWVENNIRLEQVLSRNAFVEQVFPELWQYLLPLLKQAKENGWLL